MSAPTIRQLASQMAVSERLIYMARRLIRLRPDLAQDVERGELSLNEGLRMAERREKPTSWDRLVRAWNNATDDDRERLLLRMLQDEAAILQKGGKR